MLCRLEQSPAVLPREALKALFKQQLKISMLAQATRLRQRATDLPSAELRWTGNITPLSWLSALCLVPNLYSPQFSLHLQCQTTSTEIIHSSVSQHRPYYSWAVLKYHRAHRSLPTSSAAHSYQVSFATMKPAASMVYHDLNIHRYF